MGGAFFVAKSCEDLGGADCVIVGNHLQSEWQPDGSSRLINRMPYPRKQATAPLLSARDSHLFPRLEFRDMLSVPLLA
jgi:hypothetical protein